jgi:ATP-dependent RNA helicase DOB1
MEIQEKIKATKKKIASAHSIMQLDELKCRKRVLRRLGFISDTDVVQLKARFVTPVEQKVTI